MILFWTNEAEEQGYINLKEYHLTYAHNSLFTIFFLMFLKRFQNQGKKLHVLILNIENEIIRGMATIYFLMYVYYCNISV
jgi:hypothetical protein